MNIDSSVALMNLNNMPKNLDTENKKKLKEQTDSFEALIIKQMLDITMKDSKGSLFGKSTGGHIYQSMYNDTMSKTFAGGFGYSELLFKHLTEN